MSTFQIVQIVFLIGIILFIAIALLHNQKINKEAGELLLDLNIYKHKKTRNVCIVILRVLLIFSIVMVVYSIIDNSYSCGVILLGQMMYMISSNMAFFKRSNIICENGIFISRFIKWKDIKFYEIKDDYIEFDIRKSSMINNIKIKGQDIKKIEKILDEKIFYVS